jgi:hypothetical protein
MTVASQRKQEELRMKEARFDYAGPFKTEARADEVLSQMFACDEVCPSERPDIERRQTRKSPHFPSRIRYFITLPM